MLTLRQKKWNHCFSFRALAAQHLRKQQENRLTCCNRAKVIPLNCHICEKIALEITWDCDRLASFSVSSVLVKLQLLPHAAVWPYNFPVFFSLLIWWGKYWKNGGKADNHWWDLTKTFVWLFSITWRCRSDCLVRLNFSVGTFWKPRFSLFSPLRFFSEMLVMFSVGTERSCDSLVELNKRRALVHFYGNLGSVLWKGWWLFL